ncbi:BLUF domain-containing protein [Sphingomonas sp. S1-29]|uniref:BLUF domain-containing protein n=1 Tax=Sphingomonas sp. S1-29 TaxID=2991074 RepID=UPI00223EB0B1|nr:BLUF domain-containing protein [Sphingomonas sp. S1-29]UZK69691.1 BLUF domain-containing protein [Sphingomonas sp. S1-29]
MLQLVYISSARGTDPAAALRDILLASQRNNARDGITGLLYSDGLRFLQAIEGPADCVEAAFERIKADPRHWAIVVLSRREIEAREFGDWEMAHRSTGADANSFVRRVQLLTQHASPNVRATFESFVELRRVA